MILYVFGYSPSEPAPTDCAKYSWMRGWLVQTPELPDLRIDIICPATDVHIRKVRRFAIHAMEILIGVVSIRSRK